MKMNKWAKILIGLILILVIVTFSWYSASLGSFWNFQHAAWELLKGALAWIIFLLGVLFLVLGINELRE